jgi:hypothetical protein
MEYRGDIAQLYPTYLEEHCKADSDDTLGGIVKASEAIDQALACLGFESGVAIR